MRQLQLTHIGFEASSNITQYQPPQRAVLCYNTGKGFLEEINVQSLKMDVLCTAGFGGGIFVLVFAQVLIYPQEPGVLRQFNIAHILLWQ